MKAQDRFIGCNNLDSNIDPSPSIDSLSLKIPTVKRKKTKTTLERLLDESNKYDMKSECILPKSWLRERKSINLYYNNINSDQTNLNKIRKSYKKCVTKNQGKSLNDTNKYKVDLNLNNKTKLKDRPLEQKSQIKVNTKSRKLKPQTFPKHFYLSESISSIHSKDVVYNLPHFKSIFIENAHQTFVFPYDLFNLNYSENAGVFDDIQKPSLVLDSKKKSNGSLVKLHSILFPDYSEEYLISFQEIHPNKFNPIIEIGKIIEYSVIIYFPQKYKPMGEKVIVELNHSYESMNEKKFIKCVKEYNNLIKKIHQLEIIKTLKQVREVPLEFIHDILQICYTRTIHPRASSLKEYKGFSNFVYGELLPNFLSNVYKKCGLKPEHVFMDLGSGIGNCVIQASLEFGCKLSFGCEIMNAASELTELQFKELQQRCKLWGLNLKPIEFLLRKSFVDNERVNQLIPECDVLLINNFIFDSKLNQQVEKIIQSLKPGCKIITLKNLRPLGYTINFNNVDNILNRLKVEKFSLPENSVSWTYRAVGDYYISTIGTDIDETIFNPPAKGRIRGKKLVKYTR